MGGDANSLLINIFILGEGEVTTILSLDSYIGIDPAGSGYYCTICNKPFAKKGQLRNHLQSIHFPDSFSYACSYCTAVFNTRNKLYIHKHALHKSLI